MSPEEVELWIMERGDIVSEVHGGAARVRASRLFLTMPTSVAAEVAALYARGGLPPTLGVGLYIRKVSLRGARSLRSGLLRGATGLTRIYCYLGLRIYEAESGMIGVSGRWHDSGGRGRPGAAFDLQFSDPAELWALVEAMRPVWRERLTARVW